MQGGSDGADGLAAVSCFADGTVDLRAADRQVHCPFPFQGRPVVGGGVLVAVFAESGKSSFCVAVLEGFSVHSGGFYRQGDDVPSVFGGLGAGRDGDSGHPAPVGVTQNATFFPAVKSFILI